MAAGEAGFDGGKGVPRAAICPNAFFSIRISSRNSDLVFPLFLFIWTSCFAIAQRWGTLIPRKGL